MLPAGDKLMKRLMIVTALVGAMAFASGAQAQATKPQDLADLQCLALTAYLGGQVPEGDERRAGLAAGVMYYLGRLEGRTPGVEWLSRLAEYLETAQVAELQGQAQRCGEELKERGTALSTWGSRMAGVAPNS